MDDVKLALLGNKEAAKRLTEKGVLVGCPFCGSERAEDNNSVLKSWVYCRDCMTGGPDAGSEYKARLAWNTRAQILSESEMEMLCGKENP